MLKSLAGSLWLTRTAINYLVFYDERFSSRDVHSLPSKVLFTVTGPPIDVDCDPYTSYHPFFSSSGHSGYIDHTWWYKVELIEQVSPSLGDK